MLPAGGKCAWQQNQCHKCFKEAFSTPLAALGGPRLRATEQRAPAMLKPEEGSYLSAAKPQPDTTES
jgi:hypothetical protein